jgi:hypothetical protein
MSGKISLYVIAFFVTDDEELLPAVHKPSDILAEEGEGRVGDHDVRLFQKRDALGAAEIATGVLIVSFQALRAALLRLRKSFTSSMFAAPSPSSSFTWSRLTASALGFWRLPFPSLYSGNKVP